VSGGERERAFAVVLNWNGGETSLACIRSLLAEGLAPERIVFVDNASTDGSRERVLAAFPGLDALANPRNLGYGEGTNRGIERALARGAAWVLLVNNDVTFSPGALARLFEAAERSPGHAILGPRIVLASEPGRLWAAGGRITFRTNMSTLLGHRRPDGPRHRRTREVDYVPGCAMLVRRPVFEAIGLLEGTYFAYHEDVEFCFRAGARGFRSLVVGESLALHDAHHATGGGYNERRKYMMGVNTVWFLRRNGTPARWASFVLFDVCTLPFAWAWRALRGEGAAVLAKARGIRDGLRGERVTEERLRALGQDAGG
jgi:GT2 family glycosyltransferase